MVSKVVRVGWARAARRALASAAVSDTNAYVPDSACEPSGTTTSTSARTSAAMSMSTLLSLSASGWSTFMQARTADMGMCVIRVCVCM